MGKKIRRFQLSNNLGVFSISNHVRSLQKDASKAHLNPVVVGVCDDDLLLGAEAEAVRSVEVAASLAQVAKLAPVIKQLLLETNTLIC